MPASAPDQVRARLRQALTAAMKRRDRPATAALRSALAAIDNAEAVPAPDSAPLVEGPIAGATAGVGSTEATRQTLSEAVVDDLVRAELTARLTAAAEYERLGQHDHAARMRAEAAALEPHVADTGPTDRAPAGP